MLFLMLTVTIRVSLPPYGRVNAARNINFLRYIGKFQGCVMLHNIKSNLSQFYFIFMSF